MGPIIKAILKGILNGIFKGLGFTDADVEIIVAFLALIFSKAFTSKQPGAAKQQGLNYMSRMVQLGKQVSDQQLKVAFETMETSLVKQVEKAEKKR